MNLIEWAKNEVELACKRENPDRKAGEWDYGCACYESALKAIKSLAEDNHSGYSISFTKNILDRLIEWLPLTPIENIPDMWELAYEVGDTKCYSHKRMSGLFKDVNPDGTVSYKDVNRARGYDLHSPYGVYSCGLITRLIDELYPITWPYMPATTHYKVYTEEWLTDRKNGDYDTIRISHVITPDGKNIPINRYYAEIDGEMKEIKAHQYLERVSAHRRRVELEKNVCENDVPPGCIHAIVPRPKRKEDCNG